MVSPKSQSTQKAGRERVTATGRVDQPHAIYGPASPELSELVGLHPRHFSTLFRRAFGVTPHRYVIDQRLAEGARLLANGGQDIADIAFRVGFSSQSHFAAAFRQAFGKTPRTYAAEKRIVSAVF